MVQWPLLVCHSELSKAASFQHKQLSVLHKQFMEFKEFTWQMYCSSVCFFRDEKVHLLLVHTNWKIINFCFMHCCPPRIITYAQKVSKSQHVQVSKIECTALFVHFSHFWIKFALQKICLNLYIFWKYIKKFKHFCLFYCLSLIFMFPHTKSLYLTYWTMVC